MNIIGRDRLLLETSPRDDLWCLVRHVSFLLLALISLAWMFWLGMRFEQERTKADIKVYFDDTTVSEVPLPY